MQTGELGKVYQDGETIIRQGDVGDTMYVVQEGQVEVVVEQDSQREINQSPYTPASSFVLGQTATLYDVQLTRL